MISFELSDDHENFRKVVRDFAEREVAPHVAQWDRDHHLPLEIVRQMGDLGFFGLVVPEEYGGAGGDFTSLCVAIEELGRVDQSIGITLEAGVGLGINPILTYGTEEQKQTWLPDLVAGRALAGIQIVHPVQHPQQRGFAAPGRPDHPGHLALQKVQVDRFQRPVVAIEKIQVTDRDPRRARLRGLRTP